MMWLANRHLSVGNSDMLRRIEISYRKLPIKEIHLHHNKRRPIWAKRLDVWIYGSRGPRGSKPRERTTERSSLSTFCKSVSSSSSISRKSESWASDRRTHFPSAPKLVIFSVFFVFHFYIYLWYMCPYCTMTKDLYSLIYCMIIHFQSTVSWLSIRRCVIRS